VVDLGDVDQFVAVLAHRHRRVSGVDLGSSDIFGARLEVQRGTGQIVRNDRLDADDRGLGDSWGVGGVLLRIALAHGVSPSCVSISVCCRSLMFRL